MLLLFNKYDAHAIQRVSGAADRSQHSHFQGFLSVCSLVCLFIFVLIYFTLLYLIGNKVYILVCVLRIQTVEMHEKHENKNSHNHRLCNIYIIRVYIFGIACDFKMHHEMNCFVLCFFWALNCKFESDRSWYKFFLIFCSIHLYEIENENWRFDQRT